jgi:serine protease Do
MSRINLKRILTSALAGLLLTSLCPWPVSAKTVAPDFVELAKRLKPMVVNISTTKTITPTRRFQRPPTSPFGQDYFDDFFNRFFENNQQPHTQRSLGTGFIISNEGYIITNNHVVSGADEIKVKFGDGREFKGEVKGTDEKLDIALVKISTTEHFPVATLGDSDKLQVGEWVMAIGNPFGLEQTVTSGIVSAKGRVIGSGPYDDYIQTDASINPGNSGGPLFNAEGQVIGINTAIIAGGQGIGFAIPINMAKAIIPQLQETGRVTRGRLGVMIQPLTADLAKSFGVVGEKGALVSDVVAGSPAEKAGLKVGDIIVRFEGKSIDDSNELPRLVATTPVGTKAKVEIVRNGKHEQLTVVIDQLQDGTSATGGAVKDLLGMTVQELTAELAGRLRIAETRGVVVTQVAPTGTAADAGLRPGDLIQEINGQRIATVGDYDKALAPIKKGEFLRMLVKRGNSSLFVAVKVG